ncbi:phosphatase PAP2 family protein [Flavobacterium silvisoli]|uniref:Phosphatase PAP2 family protein n=1 Tax=Flavobacterium silvisoli TaxID=2529433 RepID=A0A4Q9YX29_9FLAO|nr:phosphatase PAP2 family protein [Flavobacterium silvisoli]TBX68365.1 phosphatase PAP2 family protein [Flavobacterium silvisoli]
MNRFVVWFLFLAFQLTAQQHSEVTQDTLPPQKEVQLPLKFKQFIIPSVLIGYGIIGLESEQIKSFNLGINEEVTEHIDKKITVDDFSQYLPMASIYGLSALGVPSKNSTKDKTIILATSYILMGLTVNTFKQTASVQRPDGSSYNSFPSGHTATAFMGAELMMQEYKHESVWYGISGYVVATGTGIFRMYNNRHWLTDVVAGAGIGILSAKAGYWLYPITSKWFTKKDSKKTGAVVLPFHDGRNTGFGFVKTF